MLAKVNLRGPAFKVFQTLQTFVMFAYSISQCSCRSSSSTVSQAIAHCNQLYDSSESTKLEKKKEKDTKYSITKKGLQRDVRRFALPRRYLQNLGGIPVGPSCLSWDSTDVDSQLLDTWIPSGIRVKHGTRKFNKSDVHYGRRRHQLINGWLHAEA